MFQNYMSWLCKGNSGQYTCTIQQWKHQVVSAKLQKTHKCVTRADSRAGISCCVRCLPLNDSHCITTLKRNTLKQAKNTDPDSAALNYFFLVSTSMMAATLLSYMSCRCSRFALDSRSLKSLCFSTFLRSSLSASPFPFSCSGLYLCAQPEFKLQHTDDTKNTGS